MADLRSRHRPFSKGSKVFVTIEEALQDILIVCLDNGNKQFRGVLLDTSKRNIPHGLYRPFSPPGGGDVSHFIENDLQVKRQSENVENTDGEVSASVLRHTYTQDYSQMGFKSRALSGKGYHGEFKSKTIRNIRLRPRQILCSKCKSTCTESNLKPVTKIDNRIHRPQMMMPNRSTKLDTQKQNSALYTAESKPTNKLIRIQKPIVTRSSKLLAKKSIKQIGLPDTKQHKPAKRLKVIATRLMIPNKSKSSVKVEPKRKEQPDIEIHSILNLCDPSLENTILDVVHDVTSETECVDKTSTVAQMETATVKADTVDNTAVNKIIRNDKSAITKVSPVIKISIGDGAVLKIPSRLHSDETLLNDSSETEDPPEEDILDTPPVLEPIESTACQEITMETPANGNYSWQKKLRKAWKKEKDRGKQKPYPDLQSENKTTGNVHHHHRKHKRKHKHRHNHPQGSPSRQDDLMTENNNDGVVKISDDENVIEISPDISEVITQRPRLLYTWHQQKGLSRVETNGNEMLEAEDDSKSLSGDHKLHSGRDSGSSIWDSSIELNSNSGCSSTSDGVKSSLGDDIIGHDDASDGSLSEENDTAPHGEGMGAIRPLMMRIQTRDVLKCIANDGRHIHVGDIVWGKIQGFPWWPGRVLTISVSQRDNGLVITQVAQVSWFGSSTMSHMQCTDLRPFLEDFNLRYNRKKRGAYKMAIKQATVAAQSLHGTNSIDFEAFDL